MMSKECELGVFALCFYFFYLFKCIELFLKGREHIFIVVVAIVILFNTVKKKKSTMTYTMV